MPDTIDPNIALQAGRNISSYGPDLTRMLQLRDLQMKMQLQQQQVQRENALRQLLSQPNAIVNGMPTPDVVKQIYGLGDPEMAMKIGAVAQAAQRNQFTQAKDVFDLQQKQRESRQELLGEVNDFGTNALQEYNNARAKNVSANDAVAAGQAVWTEGYNQLKTMGYSDAQLRDAGITPNFNPGQVYNFTHAFTSAKDAQKDLKGELYTGTTADGKTVTARLGPQGFVDIDNPNEPLRGLTNITKVGTTPQLGAGALTPGTSSDVHGDDYLKSLPEGIQTQVKALAEGRMSFPSGFALRSPYWQQMLQAVSQYDPSFDAVNYQARARTRADFTSGPSARNITSFDTAIGHLGTLSKAADELKNHDFRLWNTVGNWLLTEKGDPRVTAFNTAKQAVSDELTRAFRGSGGNVADIKGWEEQLNSSNSPEQLHKAVEQAVDLLRSRIDAVGEQYKRGMGTTADVMDLLTPAAKRTLASLPGGEDLLKGEKTEPQSAAPSGRYPTPAQWQVQRLRDHPDKAKDFDEKFGPGAAEKILGQ